MIDGALARGETAHQPDRRPAERGRPAEDVVGSIDVERSRAVVREQRRQAPPDVMIGWADLGAPTVTVLARHGATALSLEKRFSGRGGIDAPLAPLGRGAGAGARRRGGRRGGIDRIVGSPLLRTRQTAQVVADAVGLAVEIDEGFAECAFGEWDGRTFAEVKQRWPERARGVAGLDGGRTARRGVVRGLP